VTLIRYFGTYRQKGIRGGDTSLFGLLAMGRYSCCGERKEWVWLGLGLETDAQLFYAVEFGIEMQSDALYVVFCECLLWANKLQMNR